jgi:hypothetical protein
LGQLGQTKIETPAKPAARNRARREGFAHQSAAPTVGLQANTNPSAGTAVAPANSGDHCETPTAAANDTDPKTHHCALRSRCRVTAQAKANALAVMKIASATRSGNIARGVANKTAGSG